MPQDGSECAGRGGKHGGHLAALFVAIAGELRGPDSGQKWTRPDPAIPGKVFESDQIAQFQLIVLYCMYVCSMYGCRKA